MIDIGKYTEDKINIWFSENPKERVFLDEFVEKNNLQKQSLGIIIIKMSDKDRERFSDLLKILMGMSEEILKAMGEI